jgi:hypothetical protein
MERLHKGDLELSLLDLAQAVEWLTAEGSCDDPSFAGKEQLQAFVDAAEEVIKSSKRRSGWTLTDIEPPAG